MEQRHLAKELERAETIGDRPADGRKGAIRSDEPLLDFGITPGAAQDNCIGIFEASVTLPQQFKDIQQGRVNDEAVVIIEAEVFAVGVKAIAAIPVEHLA